MSDEVKMNVTLAIGLILGFIVGMNTERLIVDSGIASMYLEQKEHIKETAIQKGFAIHHPKTGKLTWREEEK